MKILELFAGSQTFTRVARSLGHEVYSSDIEPEFGTDYTVDIFDFDISKLPFKPDVIWASPPCTAFSVAAIGKNWNKDYTPKHERATEGLKIIQRTLDIIKEINPKYYFIENPRGMLRKLPIMDGLPRCTVTYCQYGDTRMKPTDIWTNSPWLPRPMCKNGNSCHVAAPRGSRTGTQGLENAYERSKIPEQLAVEILRYL